ncbi:MAG: SiaB family protein kinase [Tenuifilaceae bacterium]|jgi:hypothetical protein|nr:SiaB family protein kinase [Tenuifilaceae bacterium]
MNVEFTTDLLKSLESDDLVFAYSGVISDTITHKIIELTQSNIDSAGNFVRFKNKISFLMAECYQNVARHSKYSVDVQLNSDLRGAFYVRSFGNRFHIASANAVSIEFIETIKEKLDKVNSLSAEELRLLQKQVLAQGKLSERGGAGLGIIEMARRTGQKILYEFEPIGDNLALFFLQLNIVNSDDQVAVDHDYSLEHMKSLYRKMQQNNLLVIHKGDFSENSVLPIIHMIEKNILRLNEVKHNKQKLYNISVELLQNISMHAARKNGVNEALFTLKKSEDGFIIGTSNYIDQVQVDPLKDSLNEIYLLTKSELNSLYREKLRLLVDEGVSGVGIGLIYIFRKSNEVRYAISPAGEQCLVTFLVKL